MRGTTPSADKQPTFFVFLLVRCLPLLGRAILVSQLPHLLLLRSSFSLSLRHHVASSLRL